MRTKKTSMTTILGAIKAMRRKKHEAESKHKTIAESGITIQTLPINAIIDLGFAKIHGLNELKKLVEKHIYNKDGCEYEIRTRDVATQSAHVGDEWERYPIFDSSDLFDDRRYCNYIIRQKPIKDSEMIELINTTPHCNHCRLHESTPVYLLPMVYYKGDSNVMLVALPKIQRNHK